MSTMTTPAQAARQELTGFGGRLIGPGDADYDEARAVYNAMIDKRPALIARCADAEDVADGRRLRPRPRPAARRPRRRPQRRGPGDLRRRGRHRPLAAQGRRGRPRRRTVRVGGGCTWGDVDTATNEHGLATPSGIISTTGVGGLTLGGGLGHLTPQVRPGHRQPARGRARAGQRRARPRERRREPGPVLGDPRRRRQLRRRHLVHVPPARGRHGLRRPDVLAAWRTAPRSSRPTASSCPSAPRELNGFFAFHTVPPGTAVPRGDPPAQGVRHRLVLRRRARRTPPRRWQPLMSAVPEPLHARRRADAAPDAAERLRRPLPEGRPVVLARGLRQRDPRRGRRHPRPLRQRHADA